MARFDAANAEDPRLDEEDGVTWPQELLYARRMTRCLQSFEPNASEVLQLAARCQHIRRWEIPRSSYAMDRTGYRRWRSTLYEYHAEKAGEILAEVGYGQTEIERVKNLVRKRRLKKDPEAQTLEDVVCLVFLEYYFSAFAAGQDREKLLNIVRKTWAKMSERGQKAALSLEIPPHLRRIVVEAVSPSA